MSATLAARSSSARFSASGITVALLALSCSANAATAQVYTVPPSLENAVEVRAALQDQYPASLSVLAIGGTTNVQISVAEDGNVSEARIRGSSGIPELDDAARRVARVMRFSPALNGEDPVAVSVVVPINFEPTDPLCGSGPAEARPTEVETARHAIDGDPLAVPDPERELEWIDRYNRAIAAVQNGDLVQAAEWFEAAHGSYRARPEAAFALSRVYSALGEPREAERIAWDGVGIVAHSAGSVPRSVAEQWEKSAQEARQRLGTNYLHQQRWTDAAAAFGGVLERVPQHRDALHNLALTHHAARDWAALVDVATRLQESDPLGEWSGVLLAVGLSGACQPERAMDALRTHNSLPIRFSDLALEPTATSSVEMVGRIENVSLGPGAEIPVRGVFFGVDGEQLARVDRSVTLPAHGESVEFAIPLECVRPIGGYRYEVRIAEGFGDDGYRDPSCAPPPPTRGGRSDLAATPPPQPRASRSDGCGGPLDAGEMLGAVARVLSGQSVDAAMRESRDCGPSAGESTLDRISRSVQQAVEPLEEYTRREARRFEAENRRRIADAQQEVRRREEAERRRQEEARRRRQEAANRRPSPTPTEGGVVIGPTPEERRQAELEEERRRQEEARRRQEEERRRQEEERRRREEVSRTPSWVDPTSPHPPCRGQGLDTFTEASVRTRCEMFLRNHALVEGFRRNAQTITITVHSTCEVDHSSLEDGDVSSVYVLLKLEGAITGTSRLTGAWFGTGLPSFDSGAGAINLPTSRRDSQAENWLSPRWQQYRITYDARRHGSGPPLTFEWSRSRTGPYLAQTGTRTTRVVDGGVYDFQGSSTGSLPSCFR